MTSSLILIADDDKATRCVLARCLQRQGFSTLEAPDGLAALDVIRAVAVDLVIVDLGMPKLDGHALCRAIREDEQTSGTRMMVVTGGATVSSAEELMGLDADDYMGKPFVIEELVGRVRALLHRTSLRAAHH